MKRRTFAQLSMSFLGGASLLSGWQGQPTPLSNEMPLRKTRGLRKGDTIGLISPAGPIRPGQMQEAKKFLARLDLVPQPAPNCEKQAGYLAGTDKERVSDIHYCLEREDIDAIWCLRGGYGLTRILDQLDYELFREKAKPLIGYSDITALHLALFTKAQLVSFHGPVLTSDFNSYVEKTLKQALFPQKENQLILPADDQVVEVLNPGEAEGPLIGGNLSLLSTLAGTPYLPSFKDHLVFIEDVEEEPYRIDRMLTQLVHAADLNKAAGIILGQFAGCEKKPHDKYSFTLRETLNRFAQEWPGPVMYGFSIGHIKKQCTLPMGIRAKIDTQKPAIQFLEPSIITA